MDQSTPIRELPFVKKQIAEQEMLQQQQYQQQHQDAPPQASPKKAVVKSQSAKSTEKNSETTYFGITESDLKSGVIVFALVLIFSSSIFFDTLKPYVPIVSSEGKTTLIGSLISAIIAAVVFMVMKIILKM